MADDTRRFLTVEEAREQALQACDDGVLAPTQIIDRLIEELQITHTKSILRTTAKSFAAGEAHAKRQAKPDDTLTVEAAKADLLSTLKAVITHALESDQPLVVIPDDYLEEVDALIAAVRAENTELRVIAQAILFATVEGDIATLPDDSDGRFLPADLLRRLDAILAKR